MTRITLTNNDNGQSLSVTQEQGTQSVTVSQGDGAQSLTVMQADEVQALAVEQADNTQTLSVEQADEVQEIPVSPDVKFLRGATFTPHVDEEGNLSWTNDGGLENPETVNIKGPKGDGGDGGGVSEETDPTVPDWAKQPEKPTYTAEEVGALPATTEIPEVPKKVSAFENDAHYLAEVPEEYITEDELAAKGYLTDFTETDPTVPAWAKAATKPSYTADEVGADSKGAADSALESAKAYADQQIAAIPTPDVSGQINTHNVATDAHNDIRLFIQDLTARVNALADSDDDTLDQMSEIVAYIKANRELVEQVTTAKVNVSDIIDNLSTNVSDRPLSAAQGVALKALIDAIKIPTNVSAFANDAGYATTNAPTDVPLTETVTAKFKTSNGGSITFGKEGPNSGTMMRLDQEDGTTRLLFRSSATKGAMVWEQPEEGAELYVDLGKKGNDYRRVTFPSKAGRLITVSQVLDMFYPVGSIYSSVNDTDPSTFMGGTWERIQGRFLFAADGTHAAGSTGGEATHTLTVNEMPTHSHKFAWADNSSTASENKITFANASAASTSSKKWRETNSDMILDKGGGKAHNNMPPYLAVYMWKRTA